MQSAEFDFEMKRKIFHLGSLIIPLLYIFLSKLTMILLLVVTTAIVLYVDISRHYRPKFKKIVDNFFVALMRPQELSGSFTISGMGFLMMGVTLVVILFPKGLAITSMLVLVLADTAAALTGIRFGTRLPNGKSIVGSVTFFVITVLISVCCYFTIGYSTTFRIILLSSIITTAAEFYASKWYINDNILIPSAYALSTVILSFIL